jgi:hypothetical protein
MHLNDHLETHTLYVSLGILEIIYTTGTQVLKIDPRVLRVILEFQLLVNACCDYKDMKHCHSKTQLQTTFAYVATFTLIFFRKKNPKASYGTILPHGQGGQKLCLGVTKNHIS